MHEEATGARIGPRCGRSAPAAASSWPPSVTRDNRPRYKPARRSDPWSASDTMGVVAIAPPRPKHAPPGLDAGGPYLSRLSARSALYADLRLLLGATQASADAAGFRAAVVEDNRLLRPSGAARAKLWKELKGRYVLDPEDQLFAAFRQEWSASSSERDQALTAYVMLALNDKLVVDLGVQWLYPHLRAAPVELRVGEVVAFLERAELEHPEVTPWTAETRIAVAQKYLASIRDFGLATGKTRKVSVRPALYGAPVRLLIRGLRLAGESNQALLRSEAFKLLAIAEDEVVAALGELNRQGELRFRMQADVIELDAARQH